MRFAVHIGLSVAFAVLLASQHYPLGVGAVEASMHDLSDAKSTTSTGRPRGRRLATQQWCVAKPNLENANYQGALDWVCGPLSGQGQVNCGPLQASQSCFLPNTYQAHASWAFNVYYQTHGQTSQACDFQGTATLTTTDPSTATCPYTGTTGVSSIVSSGNSTNGTAELPLHKSSSYVSALLSAVAYFLVTAQAY